MKPIIRTTYIIIFFTTIFILLSFNRGLLNFSPPSYSISGQNITSSYQSNQNNNIVADLVVKKNPGIPLNLSIPSIGVDAPIEQVGLTKDGNLDVPKDGVYTGWFDIGAKPGEMGSAVINGHYGTWPDGSHSVFDNLSKIKVGDKVSVRDDKGQVFDFVVTQIKTYGADAVVPEIFNRTDGSYLNLITCNGEWIASQKTYTKRFVVFTELVNK